MLLRIVSEDSFIALLGKSYKGYYVYNSLSYERNDNNNNYNNYNYKLFFMYYSTSYLLLLFASLWLCERFD